MVIMNNDACVKSINNWKNEEKKNHPSYYFGVFRATEHYDRGWFKKICFFPFVNVFRLHGFDDVAKQNDMKM